jgi:hypothetical protein
MDRRGFSSRLLKLGVFSSLLSKLPRLASAVGTQVSDDGAGAGEYSIKVENLTVRLDAKGRIVGADVGARKLGRTLAGETVLEGCSTGGPVAARRLEGDGVEFSSKIIGPDQKQADMIQRFLAGRGSVRWEIEITSGGEPWTVPITTKLRWPVPEVSHFWTSWLGGDDQWKDPLQPQPMSSCSWACSWAYGPYAGVGGFCIPLASVIEDQQDTGLSLVLSPEDPILDLTLTSDAEGLIAFRRLDLRLGQGRTVKLAVDLVGHEADWRGGLRWMVQRYEPFFDPPNPKVQEMAGTGAYSGWNGSIDAGRLKQMAFRVMWEAAFDWPYMGMYFPPVDEAETWSTAGYDSGGDHVPELVRQVSYRILNDRAHALRKEGFYYLSYFNFDAWGWEDVFSLKVINRNIPRKYSWTDPITFLQQNVADGIWRDELGKEAIIEGLVVMDADGPNYQADILKQIRRQIEKIPDASGLAIDRIWWGTDYTTRGARPINYGADDIVGWYHGRPGRHHSVSFRDTLSKLGAQLHGAGKVIFYNPCMSYRLDLMREVDGFFGETWPTAHGYTCLNGTGLMALRKPGIVWTGDSSTLHPDPDAYFQRHLHMGVFPMVPYPKNDHSITPDPWADQYYFDYGPLMAGLRGKTWVLEPHCIEVEGQEAKANLFAVPGGWVAPITFGPKGATVKVILRNLPGLTEKAPCEALLPGVQQPQTVETTFKDEALELRVPLKRGCTLVRIKGYRGKPSC